MQIEKTPEPLPHSYTRVAVACVRAGQTSMYFSVVAGEGIYLTPA